MGVRLPDLGILRPSTPPADFDLQQALTSMRKFRDRNPSGVALAHSGLLPDPIEDLDGAAETLTKWAETAEKAWRADEDIADALEAAHGLHDKTIAPENRAKLETLNGIHSNAAGLRRWLETTKGDQHGHPH